MLGTRAIVIGSGIAGLSAAAALVDHFEVVEILERDRAPKAALSAAPDAVPPLGPWPALPRRGVPQGRQPHLLLCGGAAALGRLFSHFETDLVAAGGIGFSSADMVMENPGFPTLPPREFGLHSVAAPRPLLESVLAARLAAHPRVILKPGKRAVRIATTADGARVTGVGFVDRDGGAGFDPADLVIDASGTGSLTLACLEQTGRAPPATETVGVDISYSSALFTLPGFSPAHVGLTTLPAPGQVRMAFMIRTGAEQWHIVLGGRGDDASPADISGFTDFADTLATPTVAAALRRASAAVDFAQFRFPANVRRRFSGPSLPPAGLLPIGDAVCRFNPIYGQGMTVAAQEAVLLGELLAGLTNDGDWRVALTEAFVTGCEPVIDPAWAASVIPDFTFTTTTGTPPADLQDRLVHQAKIFRRAAVDPEVHRAFVEARHLPKRPKASAPAFASAVGAPASPEDAALGLRGAA